MFFEQFLSYACEVKRPPLVREYLFGINPGTAGYKRWRIRSHETGNVIAFSPIGCLSFVRGQSESVIRSSQIIENSSRLNAQTK